MLSSEIGCLLRLRAGQLARSRGLIEPGSEIECPYEQTCTGTTCSLSENPQTRTIYLPQHDESSVPNGNERFFRRLEGWERLQGETFPSF